MSTEFPVSGSIRRRSLLGGITAGLAFAGGASPRPALALANDAGEAATPTFTPGAGPFVTTVAYVATFYPLWFTFNQFRLATPNRFVGPDKVTPSYQTVVAINVDTLYVSMLVDVSDQPVVVTIPKTKVIYSILTLDPYGDIFDTGIPAQTPGKYVLVGPGCTAQIPSGLTQIKMPLDVSNMLFRADKYSPEGVDQIAEAEAFRKLLKGQPLSDYIKDPTGGATTILPEVPVFAVPYKTTADNLATNHPITFLKQLQKAVASSNTPPFSPYEQALSDRFDELFGSGEFTSSSEQDAFSAGCRTAHQSILDTYLKNLGPTNWIVFTNIGDWGPHVFSRSAITEFIQYGNNHSAAAYYQTFRDHTGTPLDGSNGASYVLHFPKGGPPQAKRFWSITAYTPESIELIANPLNKYGVASYTPDLHYNNDGSLYVYMSVTQPKGVPVANWLPVRSGPFNIMLRFYGPEGSVACNTYVPPGVVKSQV